LDYIGAFFGTNHVEKPKKTLKNPLFFWLRRPFLQQFSDFDNIGLYWKLNILFLKQRALAYFFQGFLKSVLRKEIEADLLVN
jgi:hypothetical protein